MKIFTKTSKKNGVFSGLLWSFGERITAQLVSLLVTIVLARILDPDLYTPVAIVTIFITIANAFVTGGFGNALIQKKDADALDFSTTLLFSFSLSVIFYFILFLCAPLVAYSYDEPILTPVLRVMSLRICVASINSIQHAYVSKQKAFRKFFFSTLGGTIISAIVGIVMAYKGFGVWALVAQYLTNTTIDTIVLFFTSGWKVTFGFSFKRMKSLFSYGWKILVADVIGAVYTEARGMVLSVGFQPVELSYYNQGAKYPGLFIHNVEASMHKVLFQKLADEQDDKAKVKEITRKTIEFTTFILCPVFLGLASCGDAVIRILLTEKWLPCVPYLQVFCCAYALYPLHTANLNAIKAMGRSDIFLKQEIIKKILVTVLILATMGISPFAIALSEVISGILSLLVNAWPNRKLLGYYYPQLFRDVLPSMLASIAMAVCVWPVSLLGLSDILTLLIQVPLGVAVYVAISMIFRIDSFTYVLNAAKKLISRGRAAA